MKLVLASASPRRAELLQQIGVEFDICAVDIDETPWVNEKPEGYVKRVALEKARAAHALPVNKNLLTLGADTSVIVDGQILGKPSNEEDAIGMLQKLSGVTHSVLTAVALIGTDEACIINESRVTFRVLSEQEMHRYWATGEPTGKAGSYAIQGKAAQFISHLEGSFSGVMGLPLYETSLLLTKQGFNV